MLREGPLANVKIMVANRQLENIKSTIELKFEFGDFHSNGKLNGTDEWTAIHPEKSYSPGYKARPPEVPTFLNTAQNSRSTLVQCRRSHS